ncbi:hypothetical protein QR680_013122 [Steinernema hermaphroditum]|uniref:non-specific serine/threonine protein kinase n=1 Tax=Steinernema hermaphroditum TaxID=289476 RepID=A0AA39I717_9BILA|nr:hypothetical protein QR680_013122 [Steinernema hermaphroditum]
MSDTDLVNFKVGKIVCARWKVLEKLGAGGCGAVYEVTDIKNKGYTAALKVESNNVDDGGVLKLEADVLKRLASRPNVIRLIHSGKRGKYSFIVMTLCGPDLMFLRRIAGRNANPRVDDKFSETTVLRVGVHALYAIKQVHEVGFAHRDVKPGNMVIGQYGHGARMIYTVDYGMVRSFVVRDEQGKLTFRKPRKRVLLRGTLRYCSTNVHKRIEQGRVDDMWSLLYMLVELMAGLPWNSIRDEAQLQKMKEGITDDTLFQLCPPEFGAIADHLRTLGYEDRPDYRLVYDQFMKGIKRIKASFRDPFDWEDDKDIAEFMGTAISISEKEIKNPLKGEELEWKMYPTTDPKRFEENILGM